MNTAFYEEAILMIEEIMQNKSESAGNRTYAMLLGRNLQAGNMRGAAIQLARIKHKQASDILAMLQEETEPTKTQEDNSAGELKALEESKKKKAQTFKNNEPESSRFIQDLVYKAIAEANKKPRIAS